MVTKIAIIGATGSAKKRTAPALKNYSDIKITAIQGRKQEKLQQMCKEFNITDYFLNTKEMLDNADYDIIYIASPPFMHYDDIKLCFEYEKPIICEKPLSTNYEQTYMLHSMAKQKNIPVMIAHQMRHQPAYDFIRKYIKSGAMGKISFVYAKWDYMLDLTKPSSQWKCDYEKSGGGVMNDVGIHLLDFIVGLFGAPSMIYGAGDTGNIGTVWANEYAMLDYKDMACVIECSYEKEKTDNEFMICGKNACIRIPNAMGEESIKYLFIDEPFGRKTVYFKNENLYANEVIDFIKYLNGNINLAHRCTNTEDALLCSEITHIMRSMYAEGNEYQL